VHLAKGVSIGWYPVSEYEYKLGVVAQALGEEAEARFRFERALELNPNRPNTRLQLAELYARAGESGKAADQWNAVAQAEPDLMKGLWAGFGDALAVAGRASEAVEAYRAARSESPTDAKIAMNLGMLLAQSGDLSEAETLLRDAQRLAPELVEAEANLGLILATQGRFAEAETQLAGAVAKNPRLSGVWSALANVRFELGKPDAAFQAFREGLRQNPSDPSLAREYAARAAALGRVNQERAALSTAPDALGAFDRASASPAP
jgi:tetratricopeptide (TPR) repeat protein